MCITCCEGGDYQAVVYKKCFSESSFGLYRETLPCLRSAGGTLGRGGGKSDDLYGDGNSANKC